MDLNTSLSVIQAASGDPEKIALATLEIVLAGYPPVVRGAFEAAAVPHWFDVDVLSALLDPEPSLPATEFYRILLSLPMCERFGSSVRWNVHETTRRAVRHQMWHQKRDYFLRLSKRAASFFKGESVGERIEHVFHTVIASPESAAANVQNLREAIRGDFEAQAVLTRVLREYVDQGFPKRTEAWAFLANGWSKHQQGISSDPAGEIQSAKDIFARDGIVYAQAQATTLLGHIARTSGKSTIARRNYEEALRVQQQLVLDNPADMGFRCDACASLIDLGDLAVQRGDITKARIYYMTAKNDLPTDPRPERYYRQRALLLGRLADLAETRIETQEQLQEALNIHRYLAESDKFNIENRRDLAVILMQLANLETEGGYNQSAVALFDEALQISRGLSESDPSNLLWQRDLSIALIRLADLALDRDELEGASRNLEEALRIRQTLCDLDTTNLIWQRDLSVLLGRMADVAALRRDYGQAESLWGTSLRIRRSLIASDERNLAWKRDVTVALERLGDLSAERAEFERANAFFEEALSVFDEVLAELRLLGSTELSAMAWPRDRALLLARLGDLAAQRGNYDLARQRINKALDVFRALSAADPTNAIWQHDLTVSLSRAADLARQLGALTEAESLLEQALEIRHNLLNHDPNNVDGLFDTARVITHLGKLAEAMGDVQTSEARSAQAVHILQRIESLMPSKRAHLRPLIDELTGRTQGIEGQ